MQERIFTFPGLGSPNWAQFYEKFKICDKVAQSSQGSYLKALDAKLWLKSCMKGNSHCWASGAQIGPNWAQFYEKFKICNKVTHTSEVIEPV